MFWFGSDGGIDRLKNFIANTKVEKVKSVDDLNMLFEESRNLVFEYLSYYDKKRLSKKRQSARYRAAIWFFGLIGLTLPIVGTAFDIVKFIPIIKGLNLAEMGYGFIMFTAVLVGLKNYVGATNGHIRYIQTQLKLENIIAINTLVWQETLMDKDNETSTDILNTDKAAQLYRVIFKLLNESYTAVESETKKWGESLNEDEARFMTDHIGLSRDKVVEEDSTIIQNQETPAEKK